MSDVVRTVKYSARFGNKALEAELWEESGDKFLLRITQPQGKVDIELTLADVETFAKLFNCAVQPQ